jgi:hypothetical protein
MCPKTSLKLDSDRESGPVALLHSAMPSATHHTLLAVVSVAMFATATAWAVAPTSDLETLVPVTVTAGDHAAAGLSIAHSVHTNGVRQPEGGLRAPRTFADDGTGSMVAVRSGRLNSIIPFFSVLDSHAQGFPVGSFYPYDLHIYEAFTGAIVPFSRSYVVTKAQSHNVYINNTPDHWGNPSVFQRNLYSSELIQVVDQYVHSTEEGRYRVGPSVLMTYAIPPAPLTVTGDIAAIVHAAAARLGTGLGHIYNVFLPKGVDECIFPAFCFSPDNNATWIYCGHHASITYQDIGEVLYTVEPYPDVFATVNGTTIYGCDVGQPNFTVNTSPTPNGVLVDSISSLLSHETFETITDPHINPTTNLDFSGWFSFNSGDEIGDVCVSPYFLYVPFEVSERLYYIQPEYSNTYHACVTVP